MYNINIYITTKKQQLTFKKTHVLVLKVKFQHPQKVEQVEHDINQALNAQKPNLLKLHYFGAVKKDK